MSYTNQQIAKQIASLLKQNQTPIFQKGTTASTGINKELSVRLANGKVVRALGWNVSTPGQVTVFWDAQNKRYVAWKEETSSLKRKTILTNRKTRPDEKKYLWEYFIKVLQPSSIEGFDADVALDLTGYEPVGITNTGYDFVIALKNSSVFLVKSSPTISTCIIENADLLLQPHGYRGNGSIYSQLVNSVAVLNYRAVQTTQNYGTEYIVENLSFYNYMPDPSLEWYYKVPGAGQRVGFQTAPIAEIKVAWDTPANTYLNRTYTYNSTAEERHRIFSQVTVVRNESISTQSRIVYYQGDDVAELFNPTTSEITISGQNSIGYTDCASFYIENNRLVELVGYQNITLEYNFDNYQERQTRGHLVDSASIQRRVTSYLGGSLNVIATKTINPILLSFADAAHPVYKTVNTSSTTTGSVITSTTSEFRQVIPLCVGTDASIYFNIEYNIQCSVQGDRIGTKTQVVDFIDRGIPKLVIKSVNNTYTIREVNQDIYNPGEHFFLISDQVFLHGNNTIIINTNKTNTLDDDGSQYEIGFRQVITKEFEEGYYLSEKIGAYNQLKKKLSSTITTSSQSWVPTTSIGNDEFYSIELFDPVELNVDVFIKVANNNQTANYHCYRGIVVDCTYTEGDTLRRIDGTEKRYTSFTINLVEELEYSFFMWETMTFYNNYICIVPSSDYSVAICSFLSYLEGSSSSYYNLNNANCYTVTDENGNETVELAIAEIPTTTTPTTLRADIYRFNTTTLKWERRPNAITPVSPLTAASDFVSYHPTPSNSRKKRNRPPRS